MPYIALQVPQKKSVRILHETETDGARAVDARRHHQEFAVLGQFISLREIPDRTLRLVIASPSENCHSCMLIEKFICPLDRKSTRLNSSHGYISYAVFCLKKKNSSPVPRIRLMITKRPHTIQQSTDRT